MQQLIRDIRPGQFGRVHRSLQLQHTVSVTISAPVDKIHNAMKLAASKISQKDAKAPAGRVNFDQKK